MLGLPGHSNTLSVLCLRPVFVKGSWGLSPPWEPGLALPCGVEEAVGLLPSPRKAKCVAGAVLLLGWGVGEDSLVLDVVGKQNKMRGSWGPGVWQETERDPQPGLG